MTETLPPHPATALRAVRLEQGLSLRALSERVGIPYSTLSKLENGKMEMTYDKLLRLAQGLGIDLGKLLSGPAEPAIAPAVGRRSVTRAGEATAAQSDVYAHVYPAAELLQKMMIPILIEVRARSVDEMGGLVRHSGEEFLYVLAGSMEIHSDLYAPLQLAIGDSLYFDSGMAHAYVKTGEGSCHVLSVCAGPGVQRLTEATALKRMHTPSIADPGVSELETRRAT